MIRIDFCEYLLYLGDLQLSLSPDSVMFVNVNPVASSVAQDPTDIAGMDQEAGIRMCPEIVQKCKAEDPEKHHSPEP